MGKGIYTYYKERLIEIGGNNKCLCLKGVSKKSSYDIGRIFEGRDNKVLEFSDFIFSKRPHPLTLISNSEKKQILPNLDVLQKNIEVPHNMLSDEAEKHIKKIERENRDRINQALESEVAKIKELVRESSEIEKETGRYELYLGFPFVFGVLTQGLTKTAIKAPLLLFPVKVEVQDENTVEVLFNKNEKIRINPALIFAYAQSKKINVEQLELEFDDFSRFSTVSDIVRYLADAGIKIIHNESKNLYNYSRFKSPTDRELSVRYAAVLGRFPLSNSIYNDYTLLEKKRLTNSAIDELLRTRKTKSANKKSKHNKRKNQKHANYSVKMLDYAQTKVVEKVDQNGNMVIYGPPGTGKSQTIVNIITDAICKEKKVLVVSQKKAALDVVYNRLGSLNSKAMYINDECKEKKFFYERCLAAHQKDMLDSLVDVEALEKEYFSIEQNISHEIDTLETIRRTLCDKKEFGLSLIDMYSSSYMIQKNTADYLIYTKLCEARDIMSLKYYELNEALFVIKSKNLEKLYYDFMQSKEKNPLIDHMLSDIDIRTLSEVKGMLDEKIKSRKGYFNTAKHPYYRHVMAYYSDLSSDEVLDFIVNQECKLRYPNKIFTKKLKAQIKEKFTETIDSIASFAEEYEFLNKVLTKDGYISVIDNILRGNISYLRLLYEALDNYIATRDVNNLIESLDKNKISILNFAYRESKSYANYVSIIEKIMSIRIYHELTLYEEENKDELSKTLDFQNITSRIYKLKKEQLEISNKLTAGKTSRDYEDLYNSASNNKDYLYQISKEQKHWPIRKTMESYSDFILSLFPCWLLSPENVSSLLPLNKNMFDLVIFDEASQVFIESTIPAIYRGKNIVVAGDSKQLRPSTTFMKRYLGADPEMQDDPALQAALEVTSLLDLSVARYDSANLTYHYRSRYNELIDFSNAAFYSSKLEVAPNTSKNKNNRPIERHKVCGKWLNRQNETEAKKIVELLKDILNTRKNNENIGIITFNSDQQACINDFIDKEAGRDADFRTQILKERNRFENGEDVSLFVKNLENVQGDERDIIIFSIGYAPNAEGRIYTNFGSLSAEGGENRLNVAITRAKSKIIVVTSIEPEALKIEGSKNSGPKLLKKYLEYARAVSLGNDEEVKSILGTIGSGKPVSNESPVMTDVAAIDERIKEKIEKLGYTVHTNIGIGSTHISLAVYDEKSDKYLVGVEFDKDAFTSSESALERDVYKPKFLESKGWTLLRVWYRDCWLYPQKVVKAIVSAAEKNR